MKFSTLGLIGAAVLAVAGALPTQFAANLDLEEATTGLELGGAGPYTLELFKAKAPEGPVCLDGSPAGVYTYRSKNPETQDKFIIFFQGGGWCSGPEDCKKRAGTTLGSSLEWTPTLNAGGLMSTDCEVNPQFCDWSRILLPYCDGNSFTGDRAAPLDVAGQQIHFRGARIVEHALTWAVDNFGLGNATEVMLTGCSAGGLASVLNANRVDAFLRRHAPAVEKFKVMPLSGVFLDEASVEREYGYGDMIRGVVEMTQPRYTLAEDGPDAVDPCVKAHDDEPSLCHFAKMYLPHVRPPSFVINSLIDSWQLNCVLTVNKQGCGRAPGWADCAHDITRCSAEQFAKVRAFAREQQYSIPNTKAALVAAPAVTEPITALAQRFMSDLDVRGGWKVGALFHTCQTHCEATVSSTWTGIVTEEGVPMREVVKFFWQQGMDSSPWRWYPCNFTEQAPFQCNPTCPH